MPELQQDHAGRTGNEPANADIELNPQALSDGVPKDLIESHEKE